MTGTVVSLALNNEEDFIPELLEERHRTLRMEIAHSDQYHFEVVLFKVVL